MGIHIGQNFIVRHDGVLCHNTPENSLDGVRGVTTLEAGEGRDGSGKFHTYTGYRFQVKKARWVGAPSFAWTVVTRLPDGRAGDTVWLRLSCAFRNKPRRDYPQHKDKDEIEAALMALQAGTMTEDMNPKSPSEW